MVRLRAVHAKSPASAPASGHIASTAKRPKGLVVGLPFDRSDDDLVIGLRADRAWAKAALFDRYGSVVERVARRLVGGDRDIDVADVVHDAFVAALEGIGSLRDSSALEAWLRTLAARTAFRAIRRKAYRRWLCFWEPARVQLRSAAVVDSELVEAHRRTCELLARLPAKEREPFALRHVEGMELREIAEACDVSVPTVKRRIAKAEERFVRAAKQDGVLREWLEEGGRWT
jgi:RNA polymerase sigma-70 factor, ECF subfamily